MLFFIAAIFLFNITKAEKTEARELTGISGEWLAEIPTNENTARDAESRGRRNCVRRDGVARQHEHQDLGRSRQASRHDSCHTSSPPLWLSTSEPIPCSRRT